MDSKNEILIWSENFDSQKYSIKVYQELVLDGKVHPSKFEIMGAWKTGSLRQSVDGRKYLDNDGNSYFYTARWDEHTPVGKNTWIYINDNITEILPQIPEKCPVTTEPTILVNLKNRNGFGFIWGLFTLHCCYPIEYPLYDQHVYRAFKGIKPDGKPLPLQASYQWKDYVAYKAFFEKMLSDYGVDHWILDRALWSYGKWLKQGINIKENKRKVNFKSVTGAIFVELTEDENWKQEYTLGSRKKPFLSKIDESLNLTIRRRFKNNPNDLFSIFSIENLEAIQSYMRNRDWIPLANNVDRMRNGTEIDGLGSFVYNNIKSNTTFAQSTSQLAAIFVVAGIWEMDIQTLDGQGNRRMVFKFRDIDWKEALIEYYIEVDEE